MFLCVFMSGRYTEHNLWMDRIVAASVYVIQMIKQQEAGGFLNKNKNQKFFSAIVYTPSFQHLFVNYRVQESFQF